MEFMRPVAIGWFALMTLCAQQQQENPVQPAIRPGPVVVTAPAPANANPTSTPVAPPLPARKFKVDGGTKIPVSMINSISTKTAADGEKVYLETVFPILSEGKVIIPPGSYVSGTIANVKRPGRVKGRGEFYLRFDTLTLPNGVSRDFRGSPTNLDGRASEKLDSTEGKITGEGDKSGDAMKVGQGALVGLGVGAVAGQAAGNLARGSLIGAAAGATAGLAMVLLTRGPDAVLAKGTTLEMVLDRPLLFDEPEIDFSSVMPRATNSSGGPLPGKRTGATPGLGLPGSGRVPRY